MTSILRTLLASLAAAALSVLAPAPGAAQPAPVPVQPVPAQSAAAFLDTIGVNTHVDQGRDPGAYVEPLRYTGVRLVRDGARNALTDAMIHRETGVRFALTGGGDLGGLLASARLLAQADALFAIEGPNEPNNFPILYQGRRGGGLDGSWLPVAALQRDLYAAVKADPLLRRYPVFAASEPGAETDNVGLQFLTIPEGAGTLLPAGTRFADYANTHSFVTGNGGLYTDNQAWDAADPTLHGRWDGLPSNFGTTWRKSYRGYPDAQLALLPRVATETGWDSTANPGGEHTQGTILTNTYLAQFKRGWAATFVYELRDADGSTGDQGLYHGRTPKRAAVYLHNLTTLLADDRPPREAGSLAFAIADQPETVHWLLLRKSNGHFALVVWDERTAGKDAVTVRFAAPHRTATVYDITTGTAPVRTLRDAASVPLELSDHAVIVEIAD